MKKCTKCNEIKPISSFTSHKLTKDKLQCHCRDCIKASTTKYRNANPDDGKQHYLSKQEHYKKKSLDRYNSKKDIILKKQKEYSDKHQDAIKAYTKVWRSQNKDRVNEYHRERRRNNPCIKLANILRSKISTNVKKVSSTKDQSSLEIVGLASWEELKIHLESQFEDGMSWSNYGIGENNSTWHIDHILPISLAMTLEEVKELNYYTNLRPMWGSDNIRKSNKI
jgi:hypothetical protein